jgi:hypothetical protein
VEKLKVPSPVSLLKAKRMAARTLWDKKQNISERLLIFTLRQFHPCLIFESMSLNLRIEHHNEAPLRFSNIRACTLKLITAVIYGFS